MRRPPGHPELSPTRSIEGPVLLDLCRRCMAAGARHVRFPLRGISMLPTLETGDIAVVEPLEGLPPATGEIVLFEGYAGRPVIHRVVCTARRGADVFVVTASDTNPSTLDDPVPLCAVVGRVTSAERDGRPLALTGSPPPCLSSLRARFRVAFAGRPRPLGHVRRVFAATLRATSALTEQLAVLAYRLRPSPAASDAEVTVRAGGEGAGCLVLEANVSGRCCARLELQPDVPDARPDSWAILGPRLWPSRPGATPEALLRRALQVAAENGAAQVCAVARRGGHVRRYLLERAGFRPCDDPERLARLVQQAQEGDPRACDWVLLKADLAPDASVPRSPR